MLDVRVIIPSIPERHELLARAVRSTRDHGDVYMGVWTEIDNEGLGAAATRNRALEWSREAGEPAEYIAFLDDDDEFLPEHLPACLEHAGKTGADVVYPWFNIQLHGQIRNDLDPLKMRGGTTFGKEFDPEALKINNFIPVTALVRSELLYEVGGFPVPGSEEWPHEDCEDWALWLRLVDAGAKFEHLAQRTWTWNWHGSNTSGKPSQVRKIYGGGS
jgi:glycosyltransferase involved in cell wall biosynthesis